MERRKSLAIAASLALCLGSGVVAVAAVVDRAAQPPSESGVAGPPTVVTRYRDVYDRIVVAQAESANAQPTESVARDEGDETAGGARDSDVDAGSPPTTVRTAPPTTRHRGAVGTQPTTPPTTAAEVAAPSTSVPTAVPTTRPPGVPHDWPAGKPIPPMPPNCQKPQLEDDGEWNCDH
jgi:hypothetical protein